MKKKILGLVALCMLLLTMRAMAAPCAYNFGGATANGTAVIPLNWAMEGQIRATFDLHIPANITSANNAVVFGGDGLGSWASVGAALYLNSSWGAGVNDVFYTQNAAGDGAGVVQGSTLGWKNQPPSGVVDGYTTYHVEWVMNTAGNGTYQIYMTPHGGERMLVTTGTAPAAAEAGWHGFRTRYDAINSFGVWSNGGVEIRISDLQIEWDGEEASVSMSRRGSMVRADVTVCAKEPTDALFALAVYDADGALREVTTRQDTLSDTTLSLTPGEALTKDGYAAKVFLWESETMKPLCRTVVQEFAGETTAAFAALDAVKLTDGMFYESQKVGEEYLFKIDVDRLLAPCYEAAGLTPKKARYGGWEAKTISGHSLGHYLSALADMYCATGNEELKATLDYAVRELAYVQAQNGDGYVGGIDPSPFTKAFNGTLSVGGFDLNGGWVPWYSVHKIYQGLLDAYTLTGNEEALDVVIAFADWAKRGTSRLSDAQMQTMLNCEYGGMNEVFAQLYEITGNEDYLTMAVRFTHDVILNPLAAQRDELTGKHANTQIPKVLGAAEIYEQDAARTDYRTAAQFFWDRVANSRSYVIGGHSIAEHFEAEGLETLGIKTCESCNTYNMMKLSQHLFDWEHDSAYMDFYETALFNHILGSQDPLSGNKSYFISTLPGHYRIYGTTEESWWCCTGSGMENPGRYGSAIYYEEEDDLYINLFLASELDWADKGMTLRQTTAFPYEEKSIVTVARGSAEATLRFRKPTWLAGDMTLTLNGEAATPQEDGGYLCLARDWSAGDTVEIALPMALGKYTARDGANKVAFTYGPIVLAGALGSEGLPNDTVVNETGLDMTTTDVPTILTDDEDDLDSFIRTKDLATLSFEVKPENSSSGEAIALVPFYTIHHEFYNLYWFLNDEGDVQAKKLNDITIDSVDPDGQQDEIGHQLQSKNSHNGSFTANSKTYMWRDAWGSGDAYFSYDLKVDPSAQNYLYTAYWGSDAAFSNSGVSYTRAFDIEIDGTKIASQTLQNPLSGQVYAVFYDIPLALTQGKERVTVTYRVQGAACAAGGVLNVRTTSKNTIA